MRRGTIKTLRVMSKRLSAKRAAARKKGMGAKAAVTAKRLKIVHELMRP